MHNQDELNNSKDSVDKKKEQPSVVVGNLNKTMVDIYNVLNMLEVKGHRNMQTLNNVFDAFLSIGGVLEELYEDVLNLETPMAKKKEGNK